MHDKTAKGRETAVYDDSTCVSTSKKGTSASSPNRSSRFSLARVVEDALVEAEGGDREDERADVEQDESLKGILIHNMTEEIEHACMTIEWLRRNMDGWDKHLEEFLFKEGEISH